MWEIGPVFEKATNAFQKSYFAKTIIAISLQRVGMGDGHHGVGELYEFALCTISSIARNWARWWGYIYREFSYKPLNEGRFRILVRNFEKLLNILYIVGAIDGSHILVLVLAIGGKN